MFVQFSLLWGAINLFSNLKKNSQSEQSEQTLLQLAKKPAFKTIIQVLAFDRH